MFTCVCIACSLYPPEYWGWWLLQPGWRLCLYVCQFLWSPQEQQWHFHGRKGSRVCREWQKASYIFVVTMMAWYNVNEATGYMHMQYVFVNTIILLPLSLLINSSFSLPPLSLFLSLSLSLYLPAPISRGLKCKVCKTNIHHKCVNYIPHCT